MIPFNKPHFAGNELVYIRQAINNGNIAGNGYFTKTCEAFLEARLGINKVLLTHSATAALEMMAFLLDIGPEDEVIMPSFTFVTSATAFAIRGANIRFADSLPNHPNMNPEEVEKLITSKTKAILAMHYSGDTRGMARLSEIAEKNDIPLLEDAAMAIGAQWNGKAAGSIGTMGAFSFHETKNIISGQGGALLINDEKWIERAEIIREKGSNRSAYFRGEVDKYQWVDIGSSYLPSELQSAYLLAQLEKMDEIQEKRKSIWNRYHEGLTILEEEEKIACPDSNGEGNFHSYYILCRSEKERALLIDFLKSQDIQAVFHYQSLDQSPYWKEKGNEFAPLPNAQRYSNQLLRLPFYFDLTEKDQNKIIKNIINFYNKFI